MKKTFFLLILSLTTLLNLRVHAELTKKLLKETAILQLPDDNTSHWKEISYIINEKHSLVERIPLNQTIENWSELIAIQYRNFSGIDPSECSFEKLSESIRQATFSRYPQNITDWHIIEKNTDGITYEWILYEPHDNDLPQHEVARAFLTHSGFHRLGFTRRPGPMSPEERTYWIQLLKDHASVVSLQEAKQMEGLSLLETLQEAVSLGGSFQEWKKVHECSSKTGVSTVTFAPRIQRDPYVIESLEIITFPNPNPSAPLSYFFEVEKEMIQDELSKEVSFSILEESPTEILYSYSCPQGLLHLNAVGRVLLTERGYYFIRYKKTFEDLFTEKEWNTWMKKLKTIQVEGFS